MYIAPQISSLHGTDPLATFIEHSSESVVVYDTNWNFVYANTSWERLFGMNREHMKHSTLWDIFPALLNTQLEFEYRESMRTQKVRVYTTVHPKNHKYNTISCYPSKNGLCIVLRDITEAVNYVENKRRREEEIEQQTHLLEKRVEERTEALKKEKEFTNKLLESSLDGIVTFSTQGVITMWNKTMEKLTNIKKDFILNNRFYDLFPIFLRHVTPGEDPISRVLAGESIFRHTPTVLPLEDQPPQFRALFSGNYERYYLPILSDDNKVISGVMYFRDISYQNKAKEEIMKARDTALELARMKSEFLANMSHEIRTPLNAVIGFIDLIQGTSLSEQQNEWFDVVKGSADSLLQIVNQILDFSKLEAGKMQLECVGFTLHSIIQSTVSSLQMAAVKKGLDFTWRLEDHPEFKQTLYGDKGRVRQVLLNIVNNAIKFTSKGSVSVLVDKKSEDVDKIVVNIQVIDTGVGMNETTLNRIFNPFTQADATTTRCFGGTGLGLAITKQILDLMGGEIKCQSEENLGTTFFITFPLLKRNSGKDKPEKKIVKSGSDRNLSKFNWHILVAEDNEMNRKLLSFQLNELGITSKMVFNGQECIQALQKDTETEKYKLILMDVQMPVMDGYTAVAEIKKMPQFSHIPVIGMTANCLPEDRERCLNAGMSDFISKPINLQILSSLFSKWKQNFDDLEKRQ
eukprot:TRINITY_DN6198_c0_g1_i1.p1 TRINITY_DN6198_c0_g1~~TRINITY_DN6198_c0_g1_i1.p1  ORF type:complete len:688 (-),score=112.64 TRINITY_DN6198_c0_g1_i1:196-2259(-)